MSAKISSKSIASKWLSKKANLERSDVLRVFQEAMAGLEFASMRMGHAVFVAQTDEDEYLFNGFADPIRSLTLRLRKEAESVLPPDAKRARNAMINKFIATLRS